MTATAAPDRRRRNTIITAVLVVVGCGVLACLALVGAGFYFYTRHVSHRDIDRASAGTEFEAARQRFAGTTPLVELPEIHEQFRREDFGRVPVVVHRTPDAPRRPVQSLHILAYDQHEERLTTVDVPGWLVRLSAVSGKFSLVNTGFGRSDRVLIEDLERHGPGLVLDTTTDQGSRVLVWSE